MSSYTIHVVGCAPIGDGKDELFYAMNRTEMEQARAKAKRRGLDIRSWFPQTKTGVRILGCVIPYEYIPESEAPHASVVPCPICDGSGLLGWGNIGTLKVKHGCPICDGSGVCKRGHEKKWAAWQIEEMKKERLDWLSTGQAA